MSAELLTFGLMAVIVILALIYDNREHDLWRHDDE